MDYETLAEQIRRCNHCRFRRWSGVEPLAPEKVSVPVQIMFVGENPSWAEGQTVPFAPGTISGKALRDQYLSPLGLTRAQVWITDLFKCRYPRGKNSPDIYHNKREYESLIQETAKTCASKWLLKEIEIARPRVLITMSNTQVYQRLRKAFDLATPRDFHNAVGCKRAIKLGENELILFPMIHPDMSRPPGDGDDRKLKQRKYWVERHHEHVKTLKSLAESIV
jgi:uracil-DNA glycosylase family 4